jgi:hypothetical protein
LEDEDVSGDAVLGAARTLKVTLSHPADVELVDRAMSRARGDRRARAEAVNLLLTVVDRVFPKQGSGRKFPEQFSPPLRKVLKAMSIGTPTLMGSSDDHKVMYSGDYDLAEMVPLRRNAVAQFRSLVKRASKVGTITDIKVGEVPEWQMLRSGRYNRKAELDHLGRLWQAKVVTDDEVRRAKSILKEHLTPVELVEAKKELRFGVLRWTPREVMEGVKKYRGRVFRLEECFTSPGITKVDLVAWVKDKYVEVSNIVLWTHAGKPYADLPDLYQALGEDILYFEAEGKYMKVAKRMYSIAKAKGLLQDQKDLLEVLNSHLGAVYTVVGDLEVMDEFPQAVTKSRKRQALEGMRDRMAKLYFPEFDGASDPRKLLPRLREVLEEETKSALEERKMLPLSSEYKPKKA